jgi:uncharacterized protein (UPF0254 family)
MYTRKLTTSFSYMASTASFGLLGNAAIGGAVGTGVGIGAGAVNLYSRENQWKQDVNTMSALVKAVPENPVLLVNPEAGSLLNRTPKTEKYVKAYRDSEDHIAKAWREQGNNRFILGGAALGVAAGVGLHYRRKH